MKKLLAPIVALVFVLAGCSESTTGGMMDNAKTTPVDLLVEQNTQKALGKGGNGKGGRSGGQRSDPTYSDILVEELTGGSYPEFVWDESAMMVPVAVENWASSTPPTDFFGCPDSSKPCYKITVTLDNVGANDYVGVKLYPYEQDQACSGPCPDDTSLLDEWSRRSLTLYDDQVGTPFVAASAFVDNKYTFYWQGQGIKSVNRKISENEWFSANYAHVRKDRDPDYDLFDMMRASAVIYDAGAERYYNGSILSQMAVCATGVTENTENDNCTFEWRGADQTQNRYAVRVGPLSEVTETVGRGRDRTTVTTSEIAIENWFIDSSGNEVSLSRGDGSGQLWVVYLIENGGVTWTESNNLEIMQFNHRQPSTGCLTIRPVQVELFAQWPHEFDAAFSADNTGFEKTYWVNENGSFSEPEGDQCPTTL